MKYIPLLLFLCSTIGYPMEIVNHRKAEYALACHSTEIDTAKDKIFSIAAGTSINDVIKKLGPPSAFIIMEAEKYLYYGINKAFVFKDDVLSGAIVGYNLVPELLRKENDSHLDSQTTGVPRWSVDGFKYHDTVGKVKDKYGMKKNRGPIGDWATRSIDIKSNGYNIIFGFEVIDTHEIKEGQLVKTDTKNYLKYITVSKID